MKKLEERFSKDDCIKIVEWVHGYKPKKFKVNIVSYTLDALDENDFRTQLWIAEHGRVNQELVILFGEKQFDFKVVIGSNGQISYMNMGDCRFPFRSPLKLFRFMVEKFNDLYLED